MRGAATILALLAATTHAQSRTCDTPRAYWLQPGCPDCGLAPMRNMVSVSPKGHILWNGRPISYRQLRQFLAIVPQLNPIPLTFFQQTRGAPCEPVEQVRRAMDRHLPCTRQAVCAEGDWRHWHPAHPEPAAIG